MLIGRSVYFFFKQKTAYEIMPSLVGSEMCIRDRIARKSIFSGLKCFCQKEKRVFEKTRWIRKFFSEFIIRALTMDL